MLKISTRGRYGVQFMLELAINYGKGPLSLREISKRQGISEKYLWQMVVSLKSAGLIASGRGAKGGYVLAKKPSDLTLNKIVEILEGPLFPTTCAKSPSICKRASVCAARDIWEMIGKTISDTLSSYTLEDLVKKQRKLTGKASFASNYSI